MRKFRVAINGNTYEVEIEEIGEGETAAQQSPSSSQVLPRTSPRHSATPSANPAPAPQAQANTNGAGGQVTAQMPGTIIEIRVAQGDAVKQGEPLVILEAMKMANEVVAPVDGTVAEILVSPKDSVNAGDLLVRMS